MAVDGAIRDAKVYRLLGPGVMGAIALSYVMDAAVLLGFAIAGTIAFTTCLIYLASGLSFHTLFFWLANRAARRRNGRRLCAGVRARGAGAAGMAACGFHR